MSGGGAMIRTMRPEDIDAVVALRFAEFFAGTKRTPREDADGLRRIIEAAAFDRALVAEIGGTIVGTVLLVAEELEPAHDVSPWLAGLVVAPDHRGQGIGAALVRAIEAEAAALACPFLYLYTGDAEPFYAAAGWTVEDRFGEDGYPEVLMIRVIAAS
jgi:predicted N-acetyltransferase YhbS